MRIIKLSDRDSDFPDRASVDIYFSQTLQNRNPVGKFLLTKGSIARNGIQDSTRSNTNKLINNETTHKVGL